VVVSAVSLSQTGVLIVVIVGTVNMLVLSILLARARERAGRAEADAAHLREMLSQSEPGEKPER
jgi:hypothetical protein